MDSLLAQQLRTLTFLYKESEGIYRNLAKRYALSETAFWVLYEISNRNHPYTQNELCAQFFYAPQTVNSAVAALLKQGYIRLEVIAKTRNRKAIYLTDSGKQLADQSVMQVNEIERKALMQFSEEERAAYISLYQRHLEYLHQEEKKVIDETDK